MKKAPPDSYPAAHVTKLRCDRCGDQPPPDLLATPPPERLDPEEPRLLEALAAPPEEPRLLDARAAPPPDELRLGARAAPLDADPLLRVGAAREADEDLDVAEEPIRDVAPLERCCGGLTRCVVELREGTALDVVPDDREGGDTVRVEEDVPLRGTALDPMPDVEGTTRVDEFDRDGTTREDPDVDGTARLDEFEREGTTRVDDEPDVEGTAREALPDVAGSCLDHVPIRLDGTTSTPPDCVDDPARVAVPVVDDLEEDAPGRTCVRMVAARSEGRAPTPSLVRASGTTRLLLFVWPTPRCTAVLCDDGGTTCVPDRTTAFRPGRCVCVLFCGVLVTIGVRVGCAWVRIAWSLRAMPRTGSSVAERALDGGVVAIGVAWPSLDGCDVPVPRPVPPDPSFGIAYRVPTPAPRPGPVLVQPELVARPLPAYLQ